MTIIRKTGTGVRDYIHVVDLAKGHVKALEKINKEQKGLYIYNLGTGTGYSVLDMVKAFEKATGKTVAYKIAPRRPRRHCNLLCRSQKSKRRTRLDS